MEKKFEIFCCLSSTLESVVRQVWIQMEINEQKWYCSPYIAKLEAYGVDEDSLRHITKLSFPRITKVKSWLIFKWIVYIDLY